MVICLERGADLHMDQLMPLPLTVSCFSKIQTGFTFLVPAYPGSPGQRAVKQVYVCNRLISSPTINWLNLKLIDQFLTARCYACAVLAMGLCLSVTSQSSIKMAKLRITQTTPHNSSGTLVVWCQRSPRNSTGVTPYEGTKFRWVDQNRRLLTYNRLYLEKGTR